MIHGAGVLLREHVVGVLAETKGAKLAYRYAMCGLADQLQARAGEVYVAPRGCGHKLCPRCGRRRGGKYARRIIGWLAHEPHGDLWAMCLTQPVVEGEDVGHARVRMAPKQRAYMRWLAGRGLVGAMTTVHVTWSSSSNGWHYHTHILVELPAGSMTDEELREKWRAISSPDAVFIGEKQSRLVQAAGPAIAELAGDTGDTDFWHEAPSNVAKAVQYPLRDLAQGVTAWRLGGDLDQLRECARQLVAQTSGWKMFRAWGRWRKACPAAAEPAEVVDETTGEATGGVAPAKSHGSVGRVWKEARGGAGWARDAFRLLEAGCKNESDFAKRFVKYCRLAWAVTPTEKG